MEEDFNPLHHAYEVVPAKCRSDHRRRMTRSKIRSSPRARLRRTEADLTAVLVQGSGDHCPDRHAVGSLALCAMMFLEVQRSGRALAMHMVLQVGGGLGIEEVVKYGGSFYALCGIVLAPLLVSVPIALVTAELATLFPSNGGQAAQQLAAWG